MIQPDGLVGHTLGRKQMEIYLQLVHEGMGAGEMLAAQQRAIEIVGAHERVAAITGRNA